MGQESGRCDHHGSDDVHLYLLGKVDRSTTISDRSLQAESCEGSNNNHQDTCKGKGESEEKTVTVSWKKIKKNKAGKKLLKQIKSIQVQYSTDKKFKNNVNTKTVGKKKTKVTLKLQKKTTYYIRVRYKGANGFSKWSKVKRVKTK